MGFLKILSIWIMLIASGCSTWYSPSPKEVVKIRAGYDFNCENDRLEVSQDGKDLFSAKGCGMSGTYKVQCSLGPCNAEKVSK